MSGCTSDACCCRAIESHEVFIIRIVSLEPAEIWSHLVPSWSLHCWFWAAMPLRRTRPATHRFHSFKCSFRGSAQTFKSINIVIADSRRLFVLAPSFFLSYSSQLRWLCLHFLSLLYILRRYIWNELSQSITLRKSTFLPHCCFRAFITNINGRYIDTIFSDTWNKSFSNSMEEHSISSRASKSVSWRTLRNVLNRSKVRVF